MSPLVRRIGFIALAGMAATILAGVVLLPIYAKLIEARYQRDCLRAGNSDADNLITANQRLLDALDSDEVLAVRLARSQSDWLPYDEAVVVEMTADGRTESPGELVSIDRAARPAKPQGRLMQLAARLESPNRKRGLFLLAAAAMVTAMLMFSGRSSNRA